MEDEAQKMVALKKAYADIILNTAKEAAARVMASERKALRFQHDLRSTKDEALRMLVRLKQMVDSKTSEAQITSLSQQRKIDELEAQLQEAEDIITDLRSDLKRVWSELERAKNNQVLPMNEQITREDASFSENPTLEPIISSPSGSGHVTVPTSGMKSIPVNKGMDHKCCSALKQTNQFSVSDLDKFDAPESDLASIIMRTKEPELLRNGCTQRIRAFERNLLDEKLLPSRYVYSPNSNGKNEFIIKAGDKEEGKCNSPSFRNNSMDEVKHPSVGETKKPLKVRTLRRKKTRFGKAKASRKCRPRSQGDSCILPSIKAENVDMTRSSSGLEEELQHNSCYYTDKVKIIQKGKRKKKINSKDGITSSFISTDQPSSVLSRCRTFAYLVNGGVKSCEDQPNTTENEAKMKPLPRLDPGLTLIRSDVDPISGSTSVTVSMKGINKCGAVQNAADKDMELISEPASIKQKLESDAVENSEAPSSEFILDTANVSSMNSEIKDVTASEQSNGSPSHVDNGRLLKYTFQRKRKNSSSSPGETPCAKRRMEEEKCIAPQPQMIDESSRDSRRLAQVARQLISLSGKRWC